MTYLLLLISALYVQSDTANVEKHEHKNALERKGRHANALIHATSPYLLQHAYNPVEWYEWGEEALKKAKRENKPILVSIGYSACHWCHVMAHECFENKDIADIMNERFVNIKVDREERPDIDRIYMDAVHAMGIRGGWPLNVFITPEQKPFFGGTYFPPEKWIQVLHEIAKVYRDNASKINASAEALAARLTKSDLSALPQSEASALSQKELDAAYGKLAAQFDNRWGGMGSAPKFVMPTQWLFLLRYHLLSGEKNALHMVETTLKRMARGGLYDQVGGGFARYSVDERWFAPHFEKMLYDNAQLLTLYSEAYAITHDPLYKRVVYETVSWLEEEMLSPQGGFYSAIDADSEGSEGAFYVWDAQELNTLLADQPEWVADYYGIKNNGNWEHGKNILFIRKGDSAFIEEKGIDKNELHAALKKAKRILYATRQKRVRPQTDDKLLAGWNSMTVEGLLSAYRTFGESRFLALAQGAMRCIEKYMVDGKLYRSFKGKRSPTEGFLEDYAFFIRACIALYQATFERRWLAQAERWNAYVHSHFFDEEEGFYFFSSRDADTLIARKKEIFDNVIPASNGVMARNVYHLGILFDKPSYRKQAIQMVTRLSRTVVEQPSYMSHWGILYEEMVKGMAEVVVVGPQYRSLAQQMQRRYTPFALFMGAASADDTLPLMRDKTNRPGGKATAYVCFDKVCKRPVHSAEEALTQLNAR